MISGNSERCQCKRFTGTSREYSEIIRASENGAYKYNTKTKGLFTCTIVFRGCVYLSGRVTLVVRLSYQLGRVTLLGGSTFCLLKPCKIQGLLLTAQLNHLSKNKKIKALFYSLIHSRSCPSFNLCSSLLTVGSYTLCYSTS